MNIFSMLNFPVNDDWIFVRQVEAFSIGEYGISANIDPTFVLQGLLGELWGKLFGVSFASLWVLTILATLIAALGIYLIGKEFKFSAKLRVFIVGVFLLNPIIFTSAFSFMTDNYYLATYIWSLYFYIKYFKDNSDKYAMFGSFFAALSILIRQVGAVLFIAFLITELFSKNNKKWKRVFLNSVPILGAIGVSIFWPRYGNEGILKALIELKQLNKRIGQVPLVLPYFAYFSLPLLVGYLKKLNWKVLGISTVVIAPILYKFNIFAVGNVFYLEGLMIKSNFKHNLSIFDNIPVTVLFSIGVALAVSILFYLLVEELEKLYTKFKVSVVNIFIVLTSLGSFGVLLLVNDFYGRYLLPSFIGILILLAKDSRFKFNIGTSIALAIFGIITIVHQVEYLSYASLMWNQARKIQIQTGRGTSIYVGIGDVYTKYVYAEEQRDYTGLINSKPGGLEYKCYVQRYTIETDSLVLKEVKWTEEFLSRFTENPRIYDSRKDDVKSIKKHLDELMFNEEYISPKFNLIGKRAFVGSWCDEE